MNWSVFAQLVELQIIIVFLIDCSGAIDSIKGALSRWLGMRIKTLKPFDCSLCMYHWTALAYIIIIGELSVLSYMVICMLALLTSVTLSAIERIIYEIQRFIEYGKKD